MNINDIRKWLCETDSAKLTELWDRAEAVRRESVGDDVHLRGLVEFSNVCSRNCAYCGLRAENTGVHRYTLTADEIMGCANRAVELGYGTVVLQAGENRSMSPAWLADVIRQIKSRTSLAVTLSVGEWDSSELALWREAGADRYLLRFETSNQELYNRIHPPGQQGLRERIAMLDVLRDLGYETGSGVMIGLPGQTYKTLAEDIMLFADLDLDMIGCGPFIPNPSTPLGGAQDTAAADQQVSATELMTCKVIALARIVCPQSNIPATTALTTLSGDKGQTAGLMCGANVIMPNLTPAEWRGEYEIYPNKAGVHQNEQYYNDIARRIVAAGRTVGRGCGASHAYTQRSKPPKVLK